MSVKVIDSANSPSAEVTESRYFYDTNAVLRKWFLDIQAGTPRVRYKLAPPLSALDIAPKRITAIAGAPGAGKTALLVQVSLDLLALPDNLNVTVANIEMGPEELLERGISSLTGIPLNDFADGRIPTRREWGLTTKKSMQ